MNSIGSNNKSYNVMKNQIDELIKSEFNTTWCMEDFLEAYMRENGVEELTEEQMKAVTAVYDRYLRQSIHPQW